MAEYRLTVRAQDDVLSIYALSEARFGRYQAEAYHAGLERTFGLLADFAGIGVPPTNSSLAIAASASNRTTSSSPRSRTTF